MTKIKIMVGGGEAFLFIQKMLTEGKKPHDKVT